MTPAARRREYLELTLVPHLRVELAAQPGVRSALFLIAQYWNDQADDEVHHKLVFSRRETPRWPHECHDDDYDPSAPAAPDAPAPGGEPRVVEDWCEWCCTRRTRLDFNGLSELLIAAFAPLCHENGNQNEDNAYNYLPVAVVRRLDRREHASPAALELDLELVGRVARGWAEVPESVRSAAAAAPAAAPLPPKIDELLQLVYAAPDEDARRDVLADALQEIDHPRGEFIALSLAFDAAPSAAVRARMDELLARHRTAWLGAVAGQVSDEGLVFRRGFVAEAQAFFATETAAEGEEWATVEALRFLPGSVDHVPRAARGLRRVGPVGVHGLTTIAVAGAPVVALHVLHDDTRALDNLGPADLPHLRSLYVTGSRLAPTDLQGFLRSAAGRRLEELTIGSHAPATIAAWLAAPERPPTVAFALDGPGGAPAGFRLLCRRADPSRLRVSLCALSGSATIAALGTLLGTLPPTIAHVLLEPSRLWRPLPADVAALAAAARRAVVVAE